MVIKTGIEIMNHFLKITALLFFGLMFNSCEESSFGTKATDSFESNGGDEPVVPTGPNEPTETEVILSDAYDSFDIDEVAKVNILFIVDDSGSMKDDQSDLSQNLPVLIEQIVDEDIHVKMGVITTDTSSSSKKGKLVGEPVEFHPLLSAQARANRLQQAKNQVVVGIEGSGLERGIRAMELSFDETHARNQAFFDADFAEEHFIAILVSDEDESIVGWNNDAVRADYVGFLEAQQSILDIPASRQLMLSVNGQGKMNVFHSVIMMENHFMFAAGHPFAYGQLSQLSGGETIELKSNFAQSLDVIAGDIIQGTKSLRLTQTPHEGVILEVQVDGTVTTDFSFDTASNSLQFATELPAGSEVTVSYKYAVQ